MKRCEYTSRLTAYLLGDLPKPEADALAAHLASCEACCGASEALRGTLALLREAYPAEGGADADEPVLEPGRRTALLAVRAEAPPSRGAGWFARPHPQLARAAVWTLLLGGLFALLSVAFYPAGRAVMSAQREARGLDCIGTLGDTGQTVAGADPAACAECDFEPKAAADGDATFASGAVRAEELVRAKERTETESVRWYRGSVVAQARNGERQAGDEPPRPPAPAEGAATAAGRRLSESSRLTSAPETKGKRAGRQDADHYFDTLATAPGQSDTTRSPADVSARKEAEIRFGLSGGNAKSADGGVSLGVPATAVPEPKPDQTVRLNIAVPKPQFTGTPKDIRSPNLEAARERTVGPYTDYVGRERAKEMAGQELAEAAQTRLLGSLRADAETSPAAAGKPVAWLETHTVTAWDADGTVSQLAAADKKAERFAYDGVARVTAGEPAEAYAGAKIDVLKNPVQVAVNAFVAAAAQPVSTFAIDVDTASYTLARQALRSGALPEPERVRTEEVVNAFDYGDAAPDRAVFRVCQDGAQSPFGAGLNLLRIGVKGRRLGREEQRSAVLTFVVDLSGSMAQSDRIGFARLALASLLGQLGPADRIQLIAYSDHARLVLEPAAAADQARVLAAFDGLQCNGSTNLEEGMRLAYEQAVKAFVPGAENRVILLSDGVANLGAGRAQEILDQVAASRRQGITCSVFGVGAGTYNDRMLEELANKGDGVYRFLDTEEAVKSAFVDDLAATLNTIAKDAKIQVEWNPAAVRRYRQLGYENRALANEQFRDDAVDAGEVGSGQSVSALYELELAPGLTPGASLGTVRVRYRRADTGAVEEIEAALAAESVLRPARQATASFRVAACAAEFAELLRGSPHAAGGSFDAVAEYVRPAALELSLDTRVKELLELVEAAAALKR